MRTGVLLVSLLWSAAASAQGFPASPFPPPRGSPPAQAAPPAQSAPPAVGEKPLVQVKPKATVKKKGTPAKPTGLALKLQACLESEDGTKERLDCYDAVLKPQPMPKTPKAKSVMDCRFFKEEDERLTCFNGFVEKLPKPKSG